MTQIIDGYAQPDVEAIKDDEHIICFVETPSTLRANAQALKKSFVWIREHYPKAKVNLVCTVPRKN